MKSYSRSLVIMEGMLILMLTINGCDKRGVEQKFNKQIRLLKHDYYKVRNFAAGALGQIGSNAKEAVSALVQALKDNNDVVRRYEETWLYSRSIG